MEVEDFLQDIMRPQMEALFYQYETDILWCDIGGPTVFPDIGRGGNALLSFYAKPRDGSPKVV